MPAASGSVWSATPFLSCSAQLLFPFPLQRKRFFSYNTLGRMLSNFKASCILAAIQVVFQFYYFIIGQLLQYFFVNFGAFYVLSNFYIPFLPKSTSFFVLVANRSVFAAVLLHPTQKYATMKKTMQKEVSL